MTDYPAPGRMDLRVLDEPRDPDQAGRVIRTALARAGLEWRVLPWLARRFRPLAATAAALLLAGLGFLGWAPRDRGADVPASWIAEQRVPTNGELLAAFQGYRR